MNFLSSVPAARVRRVNQAPVAENGDYVVYWMIAARRLGWNFALQQAVHWAEQLDKPLMIFEPLQAGYRWASDRFHRFVVDGMAEKSARLGDGKALYYPYVEDGPGRGKGLLEAIAADACLVVTDEYPAFFLPRMVEAAGRRLDVQLEAVDGNGLLPLAATDRAYPSAYVFRRFLQRTLDDHLLDAPLPDPLDDYDETTSPIELKPEIIERWPARTAAELSDPTFVERLPIDHGVAVVELHGGERPAAQRLRQFLDDRLGRYADDRNRPSDPTTSGLSPYLHFGHLSAHRVFREVAEREGWSIDDLGDETRGHRRGWWGMSENAEAFLDQLVTWRELGYNMCQQRDDFDRYESLPDWARTTLDEHREDAREHIYTLAEFDAAATHDELWNAAQRQLTREGVMHNYLRMLWGKKILEWTQSPEDALDVMIELNNKYALDGRDPNSYSGIFWVLGRFDRAWGPERPVYGKIRYMSSKNTARKLPVGEYLRAYAPVDSKGDREPVSC